MVCGGGAVAGDVRQVADVDIGRHANVRNWVIIRREELRGREASTSTVLTEREDALDGAFAVRAGADDFTAAGIFDRTGEDFAGTRAVAVDQHDERNTPGAGAVSAVAKVFRFTAAAGRDDRAIGDELVGDLDARGEQAAGVTAEVENQRLHALFLEVPESVFEISRRGLLESGDTDVGDAFHGVDDFHAFEAGDIDAGAADRDVVRCLAKRGYGHATGAAFFAGEERSGFVGGERLGLLAVDGGDAIAFVDARLFGGAVWDDVDDQQCALVGFELDTEADKVAFDLRVDVAELIGGEERGVVIQATGGGGGEFEQRGGFADTDSGANQVSDLGSDGRGVLAGFNRVLAGKGNDFIAELFDLLAADANALVAEEVFIGQGDVHGRGTALGHGLPWRVGVVVSLDFAQEVGVLVERLGGGKRAERIAEAAIFVTLVEAVVEAGDVETGLEAWFFRRFVEGFFVFGEGVGPFTVLLERVTGFERVRDRGFGSAGSRERHGERWLLLILTESDRGEPGTQTEGGKLCQQTR